MTTLIDTLPVSVLNALAKRYLKILKTREPDGNASLMSLQEDLARAAGHRDMHAAQTYWEQQIKTDASSVAPQALNELVARVEEAAEDEGWNNKHPCMIALAQLKTESTSAATRRDLKPQGNENGQEEKPNPGIIALQEAGAKLACARGQFFTEGLIVAAQKLINVGGGSATEAEYKMQRKMLREMLGNIESLVLLDNDSLTTRDWLAGQHNLAKLSVRKDAGMRVDVDVDPTWSWARQAAVKNACGDSAVIVVQADESLAGINVRVGNDKSSFVQTVAQAHERAGWNVVATASSWQESLGLARVLGKRNSEDAVAMDPLLKRAEKTPLNTPTLIVVDCAERASAQTMAALVAMAAQADALVRVMVLGDPGVSFLGVSGLAAASRNAPVFTLTGKAHRATSMDGVVLVEQAEAGGLPEPVPGEMTVPRHLAAGAEDALVLGEAQKAARGVDPAILGRAFLQVMNDPTTQWRDRPFHEFSTAMATRAAELDDATKNPGPARRQRRKP